MNSRKKNVLAIAIFVIALVSMASCESAPKDAVPVAGFDVFSYLGKWYEIARIDFKHEKNMDNVTAEYYLNDNGTITWQKV